MKSYQYQSAAGALDSLQAQPCCCQGRQVADGPAGGNNSRTQRSSAPDPETTMVPPAVVTQ